MFGFFRRSAPRPLSEAISRALATAGMTASISNPSLLQMVEAGGRYSDRKVTYFRIFDPALAAKRSLEIRRYKDLDAFPDLVLRSGHVEQDGKVVLNRAATARTPEQPVRTRAGRIVPAVGTDVASPDEAGAPAATTPAVASTPDPTP